MLNDQKNAYIVQTDNTGMRMMNDDESWDLYMLCMFMSF
jgi:hypothetical protein